MSIKSLGGFTNAFHVEIGRGTKPVERGIWEAGGGGHRKGTLCWLVSLNSVVGKCRHKDQYVFYRENFYSNARFTTHLRFS